MLVLSRKLNEKIVIDGGIVVTVKRETGLAQLEVRDNGAGIDGALLPRVFELYFQDETTSVARTGLGLGLHIVKHVVDRHGGQATAESEGVGKGATFTVRLPLHDGLISGTRAKLDV